MSQHFPVKNRKVAARLPLVVEPRRLAIVRFAWAAAIVSALIAAGATAEEPHRNPDQAPDSKTLAAMVDRGAAFLTEHGQADDGSYSSHIGCGITALATTALLQNGRSIDDPSVAKSLKYLEQYTQESGGIHMPGGRIPIYETCVALICFKEANRRGQYDQIIRDAEAFIRRGPWDESKGKDTSDASYGGVGYGGKSRPDLSNTAFLIDALKSCGAGADDPTIQKSLAFVSRCQNHESQHNTTPFAAKVNDGGFYYTCVLGRQESQRETPDGGLRSYGSMTYSGFKSMIYAGLTKDDPRVKAALQWIGKHYDVKTNPGMGDAGLYYYYHTFAKALDVAGINEVTDAKGVRHDWRRELAEELARRQNKDGSWINTNRQWMESDPNLATAFALLALSYCRPQAE